MEAEAALRLGKTIDEWDALDEYQRAYALAPALVKAEQGLQEAEDTCPACGGLKAECQDPDNQHAYVATFKRCYRSRAIEEARRTRKSDPDMGSLLIAVHLDPTKKKSERARKG